MGLGDPGDRALCHRLGLLHWAAALQVPDADGEHDEEDDDGGALQGGRHALDAAGLGHPGRGGLAEGCQVRGLPSVGRAVALTGSGAGRRPLRRVPRRPAAGTRAQAVPAAPGRRHLGLLQAAPQLERHAVAVEADGLCVGADVAAGIHGTRQLGEVAFLQGGQGVQGDGGDGVDVAKGEPQVLACPPQLTTEVIRCHRPQHDAFAAMLNHRGVGLAKGGQYPAVRTARRPPRTGAAEL